MFGGQAQAFPVGQAVQGGEIDAEQLIAIELQQGLQGRAVGRGFAAGFGGEAAGVDQVPEGLIAGVRLSISHGR